jgi:hypothetical protein
MHGRAQSVRHDDAGLGAKSVNFTSFTPNGASRRTLCSSRDFEVIYAGVTVVGGAPAILTRKREFQHRSARVAHGPKKAADA